MMPPLTSADMGTAVLSVLVLASTISFAESFNEVVMQSLEPGGPLKCYTCLDFHSHCVTMKNVSAVTAAICAPEETFCQVERLHLKKDLLTFERRCSSSCTPGCEKAGDYHRCYSCCKNHLCNTDNSAPGHYSGHCIAGFLGMMLYYCVAIH